MAHLLYYFTWSFLLWFTSSPSSSLHYVVHKGVSTCTFHAALWYHVGSEMVAELERKSKEIEEKEEQTQKRKEEREAKREVVARRKEEVQKRKEERAARKEAQARLKESGEYNGLPLIQCKQYIKY